MKEVIEKDLVPKPKYPKIKRAELSDFPIPCYAQVKYDGELTYLTRNSEGWYTINRWGRVRRDYPVTDAAQQLIKRNDIFIGELYLKGENLYSFLKQRSAGKKLRLAVFDVKMSEPYQERYRVVAETFPEANLSSVHLAEGKVAESRQELEEFYQKALNQGFEGIVGRSPHSRYTEAALKKKKRKTADLVILGVVKESTYFQEKEMVGSVLVGCAKNGKFKPVGRVASGFTDRERKSLYEALMPFKTHEDQDYVHVKPALVIEVSYQETVESKEYDVGFTMRSPVFRRFRTDKKANQEDCGLENQFPDHP